MELLMKTEAIKLRSHLNKFLVADENRETVKQSRNGSSYRAIWAVEPSPKNPDAIRLKNMGTGLYLTASDSPFLLGWTGKQVVQLSIFDPARVEWEPISDGFQVKFRSKEGKYLRANGGPPPWRNSVTHDEPLGGTYNWILWDVEPVTLPDLISLPDAPSPMSSFNSVNSVDFYGSKPSSPLSVRSNLSPTLSSKRSGMDQFHNAKAVRLRSHHDKYLIAEEDEESVTQDRNGSSRNARWTVEFVGSESETEGGLVRLKSCYGKYLTASNHPFLLGMTGRKVVQSLPPRLDSSVEWEPIKEGSKVRLRTRSGNYLRANGGVPPWRNSVTHDVPHRTATHDWVLWSVDIVEILEDSGCNPGRVKDPVESGSESSSVSNGSDRFHRQESNDYGTYSPPKLDGRLIYYHVVNEHEEVNDAVEGNSFTFKGHSVAELTQKLEQETGIQDIFVCTRSPLNGKLYPLRLQLPPNNTTMHIVVVPSTSILARGFTKS